MKTKLVFLTSVSVLSLALSSAMLAQEAPKPQPKPEPVAATTKADDKKESVPVKASEQFQASYDELNALMRVIESLERDAGIPALRLKANSIAAILRAQIPEGYSFDPSKKEFVPQPKPAAQPQEKAADKK